MRIYLGANSSPQGPLQSTRRAARLCHCWPNRRIHGPTSSWPKREGSQVARQLRPNNQPNLWLVVSPFWLECGSGTIPLTWAEDRALLMEATRAPSQGPTPNGAARGRPLPFGIGSKALNPSGGHGFSALRKRLSFTQHVPDDRGQLAHHGDASDAGSSSALDAFEPLAQPSVLPQDFVRHLGPAATWPWRCRPW
jgi:hypothetical protein